MNRLEDDWRDDFFVHFPELLSVEDERVDASRKRKSANDAVNTSMKKRATSAALGANPDGDESILSDNERDQPVDLGRPEHEGDVDTATNGEDEADQQDGHEPDVLLVDVVPPPGAKTLQDQVSELRGELAKLVQANARREQQELLEEDDDVRSKLSANEKRGMYMDILKTVTPDLPFPAQCAPVDDSWQHFSAFKPKEGVKLFPFCPPLLAQMKLWSQPPTTRGAKKDPFKMMDKFYRTASDVEKSLLSPRFVPSMLSNEVNAKALENSGASGLEIKLKADTAGGQKELAAIRELKQSSSLLRLVNAQELSIQAVNGLSKQMTDILSSLTADDTLDAQVKAAQTAVSNLDVVMQEMAYTNTNMARGLVYQYTEAVRDRRSAWVKTSKLPQGMQSELVKAPLDFMQEGSEESLGLLSPASVQFIADHVQNRKDDVFCKVCASLPQKKPYGNNNNNNNRKKGKGGQQSSDLSQAAQSAGWSTNNSNSAQGKKPANRGGRSKAGRGRGQPFSANAASEGKK
jgi:hypothetical protein